MRLLLSSERRGDTHELAVVDVVPAGAIADDLLAQLPWFVRPPAACDDGDDDGEGGDADAPQLFHAVFTAAPPLKSGVGANVLT